MMNDSDYGFVNPVFRIVRMVMANITRQWISKMKKDKYFKYRSIKIRRDIIKHIKDTYEHTNKRR